MPTYTPIDYDPFAVKPEPEKAPEAGVLRTIGDTVIGIGQGAIRGLKTGSDLAAGAGLVSPKNGASEGFRKASDVLEGFKSQKLLGEKEALQQRIAEADGTLGKFTEAASGYLTNPRLGLDMMAENAAMLIPSAAAGRFAGKTAQALGAAEATVGKVGLGAAIGAGGIQQGTDISRGAYDSAISEGATPTQAMSAARAAFAPAAALSVGAQFLPGGASLERALVGGAARNAVKGGVMNRLYAGGRGALGEGVSEMSEEGGGQWIGNVAQQQFSNPNKDLMQGVGESAGQGLAGGVLMGGPVGLVSGRPIPAEGAAADPLQAGVDPGAPIPPPGAQAPGAPPTPGAPGSPPIPPTAPPSAPTPPAGTGPSVVVDPNAGVLSRGIAEMNGGDGVNPLAVPIPTQQAEGQEAAAPDKQAQKEEKQASREAYVDDFIDNQVAQSGQVSKEAAAAAQITPAEVREGVQRNAEAANGPAPDAPARQEPTIEDKLDTAVRSGLRSGGINRKGIAQALGVGIADVSNAVKRVRKQDFEAEQAAKAPPATEPDAPTSQEPQATEPAPAPGATQRDPESQAQAKAALDSESAFAQQAANSPAVKVDEQAAQSSGSQGDAITQPIAVSPPNNEVSNEDESTNANAGEPIGLRQSNDDGTQSEQAVIPAEKGIQGTTQEVTAEPTATSAELQPEQTPGLNTPEYDESTEVLDDDIAPSGAPFSSKQNGGYVVRFPSRPAPNAQASVQADAEPTAPAEVQTAPASIPDAPRAPDAPIAANNAQPVQQPADEAKAEVRAPRRYSPEELDGKIVYERLFDPQGNRLTHTGPLSTHKGQKPAAQFIKENDSLTESYEALLKCLGGGK